MLVEFSANAFHLHRACVRLATRLAETPGIGDDSVHFDVSSKKLEITVDGASANLQADVQRTGAASVPFTVLAGVVHVLPYFGKKPVEIGFSRGRMRVDTTVFHNRNIVLSVPVNLERRRSSFRERALQLA